MSYTPDAKRHDGVPFKRRGRSGIVLPPISVGLWQNFRDALSSAFKRLDQFQKRPR